MSDYGTDKIAKLTDFYGVAQKVNFEGQEGESEPDVDPDDTEAEWKLFRRLIFKQYRDNSIHQVLSKLVSKSDIAVAFPAILSVLPVTTATVERTFSNMKLIKMRLRKRMGDDTLDSTMRISIEGPDHLSNDTLEKVIDHYKAVQQQLLNLNNDVFVNLDLIKKTRRSVEHTLVVLG